MIKQIVPYIIILILFGLSATAILYSGENTELYKLPTCYDHSFVLVRTDLNDSQYNINNCSVKKEHVWDCPCPENGQPYSIMFYSPNGTTSTFSFVLQYYIGVVNSSNTTAAQLANDNNRRMINIDNTLVAPRGSEAADKSIISNASLIGIAIVVVIVLVICFIIAVVGVKWMLRDNQDDIVKIKKGKTPNVSDDDDETLQYVQQLMNKKSQ
jgi:hypothetical protein